MFDQQNPPGAPVEDIFADNEPPTSPGATPKSPSAPITSAPLLAQPTAEPVLAMNQSHSRRWLPWMIVAIVLVVGSAAAGWYFFLSGPKTITEIPQVPSSGNVVEPQGMPLPPAQPEQPVASVDSDGDGLTDDQERQLGTDPFRSDSDEDGLFDGEEVNIYKTNPLNADTDGDTFSDGEEVQNGYNPNGTGKLLELPTDIPSN